MSARAGTLFGLALGVALGVACGSPLAAPEQPIAFDHALHTTVQLDDGPLTCTACHAGAERGVHAGLPALATCLRCHMRPQGDPPSGAERRVRAVAEAGQPVRWIQVTRNPGHVYFSHRAHVIGAAMTCHDCHGDVASWTSPPRVPDARLTRMAACQACHRARGAPIDCATCHQ